MGSLGGGRLARLGLSQPAAPAARADGGPTRGGSYRLGAGGARRRAGAQDTPNTTGTRRTAARRVTASSCATATPRSHIGSSLIGARAAEMESLFRHGSQPERLERSTIDSPTRVPTCLTSGAGSCAGGAPPTMAVRQRRWPTRRRTTVPCPAAPDAPTRVQPTRDRVCRVAKKRVRRRADPEAEAVVEPISGPFYGRGV